MDNFFLMTEAAACHFSAVHYQPRIQNQESKQTPFNRLPRPSLHHQQLTHSTSEANLQHTANITIVITIPIAIAIAAYIPPPTPNPPVPLNTTQSSPFPLSIQSPTFPHLTTPKIPLRGRINRTRLTTTFYGTTRERRVAGDCYISYRERFCGDKGEDVDKNGEEEHSELSQGGGL